MPKKGSKATENRELIRGPGGSSFDTCPDCGKSVPAATLSMHTCQGSSSDAGKKAAKPTKDVETKKDENVEAKPKAQKPKETKPKAKKEDGETKKKRKVKENEDKPKKPLSPYMLWMNEHRPAYKEKHGDLKMTELVKLMAADWKNVSDEDKKKYLDLQAKDKERYERELKEKGIERPAKKPKGEKKASKKKKEKEEKEEDEEEEEEEENEDDDE